MDASLWLMNGNGSMEPSAVPLMHGDVEADSLQAILDLLDDSNSSGEALIQEIQVEDAGSDAAASQFVLAPRAMQYSHGSDSAPAAKKRYKESGSTRVRNELMVLRKEAGELESQLELARSRRSKARSLESSPMSAEVIYRGQKISIWRSVAHRQHRARREAEALNERLRVTVEEQRKITQQFLRSLNRGSTLLEATPQPPTTAAGLEPPITMTKHLNNIVDYDDMIEESLCETLMNKVDLLMIQATDVFNHAEFQSRNSISQQTAYGDDGLVSVIDSRVVPFDCAATSEAIWKYYSDRTTQPTVQSPFRGDDDADLMIKGFRMTLGSAFQIGHVQGMIVGRRFVDNGRVVIVWAADITPALDVPGSGFLSAKITEHLSFQAHGWTAVSQNAPNSTKIQMKHCVSPKSSSSSGALGVMLQMVSKLVAQGLCEHHETIHRKVDDAFISAKPTVDAWSVSTGLSSLFTSAPRVTLESW